MFCLQRLWNDDQCPFLFTMASALKGRVDLNLIQSPV